MIKTITTDADGIVSQESQSSGNAHAESGSNGSSIGQLSHADLAALLGAFDALNALPPRLLDAIRRGAKTIQLPAGHVIFDRERALGGLLLLTVGSVDVFQQSEDARRIFLYRLTPGEVCGISVASLLGGMRLPLLAVAGEAVRGVVLPCELMISLVVQSTAFQQYVARVVAERTGNLLEAIEDFAFGRLNQRTADRLFQRSAGKATSAGGPNGKH